MKQRRAPDFNPDDPGDYYGRYVAFGTAPDEDGGDLHGAGAMLFDGKVEGGPGGEGAQRICNYVRAVSDASDQ